MSSDKNKEFRFVVVPPALARMTLLMKLYLGYVIAKKRILAFFPQSTSTHFPFFFSKYFNWYTQEIGQFSSFLFNFSWSQILISTS